MPTICDYFWSTDCMTWIWSELSVCLWKQTNQILPDVHHRAYRVFQCIGKVLPSLNYWPDLSSKCWPLLSLNAVHRNGVQRPGANASEDCVRVTTCASKFSLYFYRTSCWDVAECCGVVSYFIPEFRKVLNSEICLLGRRTEGGIRAVFVRRIYLVETNNLNIMYCVLKLGSFRRSSKLLEVSSISNAMRRIL